MIVAKQKPLQIPFRFLLIMSLIINVNASLACPVCASENNSHIVDLYGQLRVAGIQIVNQHGDSVALGGMSLFWSQMNKVKTVIDACIELGIYVVVDWHDHYAHDHQAEAITFFKAIASLYGDKPNIIYEIYNEPEQVSWTDVIKPYAEAVINEIRKIDADNIIIVGTPTWSQDVDVAAADPLNFENIAYGLHFLCCNS